MNALLLILAMLAGMVQAIVPEWEGRVQRGGLLELTYIQRNNQYDGHRDRRGVDHASAVNLASLSQRSRIASRFGS